MDGVAAAAAELVGQMARPVQRNYRQQHYERGKMVVKKSIIPGVSLNKLKTIYEFITVTEQDHCDHNIEEKKAFLWYSYMYMS